MKWVKTVALAGAALAVANGAWAQDVKVDFDKAANFLAIKTFSIKLGTSWGNEFAEKRMKDELTAALTAKGWTLAPEDQGDALVVFHGAGEKKRDLNTFYSGMGGYGYRGWGGGGGTATTTVNEYLVGTLVVDIFDGQVEEPDLARHRPGRAVGQGREEHQEAGEGDGEALQGLPPRQRPAEEVIAQKNSRRPPAPGAASAREASPLAPVRSRRQGPGRSLEGRR